MAKEALTEKKKYDTIVKSLESPIENANTQSAAALEMVKQLENKIRDTESSASILIARAQTAKAQKHAADSLAGISTKDPYGGMKTMESNSLKTLNSFPYVFPA